MSDLEDAVRAAMRAKDSTAPPPRTFTLGGASLAPRRPSWRAPVAAVAAIVAIFALTYGVGSRFSTTPPATLPTQTATQAPTQDTVPVMTCPGSYDESAGSPTDPWVPARPDGVDGAERLAPPQTPGRVVVCTYLGAQKGALTGARTLDGDLAGVTSTLSWVPAELPDQSSLACSADLRPTDDDRYLIGLSYPGGTLWVSAPGQHCAGSSNGLFESTTNLGEQAADWYAAGHWTAPEAVEPCAQIGGRWGQSTAMVPDEPNAVAVCSLTDPSRPGTVISGGFSPLVDALNALPTRPSTRGCTGPVDHDRSYILVFSYPAGPSVKVTILAGCDPAIDNTTLQAVNATTVLPLIKDLLAGH